MKLPRQVIILGRKYYVKIVSVEKIYKITKMDAMACVDFSVSTIFIRKDLPADQKMLCIFHEIGHICHFITGLDQVTSYELQEILCESMANTFADLLRSIHGKR